MARRQWLIDARERRGWTREEAALRARMTVRLLTWLEIDDEIITAPSFIKRLKRLYRLTDDQYNSMVHEKHYIGRKRAKDDELSRIKSACKANQTCIILQDTKAAQQWLCNGEAAYKLEGIWVDEPSIRAIFDIPAKKWQEDWSHQVIELSELEPEKAEMLSAVWESQHEIELEPCDVRVLWHDEYRRFLTPDKRTVWAVAGDFEPLPGDRYALRTAPGYTPVIAVYNDLLCEGIVQALTAGAAKRLNEELLGIINAEVYYDG